MNNSTAVTYFTDMLVPYKTSSASGRYATPQTIKIILIVGYFFVFVSGVTGNLFVIYAIGFQNRLKKIKIYNSQIISLAIADLIGSTFSPLLMIAHLTSHSWNGIGDVGCKILPAMTLLASLASAWTIVLIAFSRLRVVQSSFILNKKSSKNNFLRIFGAWLLSLLVASPYSHYLKYSKRQRTCVLYWTAEIQFIFSGVFATFTNILPIFILVILHVYILIELKKSVSECNNNNINRQLTVRRKKQIRHITNTFTSITFTFFLLTTPYTGLYFMQAYNKRYNISPSKNYYSYLEYGLFFMSCLNSTVNPYFYACNIEMRKRLRTIARAAQSSLRSDSRRLERLRRIYEMRNDYDPEKRNLTRFRVNLF